MCLPVLTRFSWSSTFGVRDAFRIDHPDGLADPRQYMARLHRATGGTWIVAEKILEGDEELPNDWRVLGDHGGTTRHGASALS